jgi:hypothetical protein
LYKLFSAIIEYSPAGHFSPAIITACLAGRHCRLIAAHTYLVVGKSESAAYPAAFRRFMDSAVTFDMTTVSVSLIFTVSSLPHTGQGIKAMLCGSSLTFGFAPQFEQAYPFIILFTSFFLISFFS